MFEERLLQQLKSQYNSAVQVADQNNNNLNEKLENYLKTALGDKEKRDAENVKALTKVFNDANEYEILDPNNLKDYIDVLERLTMEFKTEVDYKLSESNATTFIEVDLVD